MLQSNGSQRVKHEESTKQYHLKITRVERKITRVKATIILSLFCNSMLCFLYNLPPTPHGPRAVGSANWSPGCSQNGTWGRASMTQGCTGTSVHKAPAFIHGGLRTGSVVSLGGPSLQPHTLIFFHKNLTQMA